MSPVNCNDSNKVILIIQLERKLESNSFNCIDEAIMGLLSISLEHILANELNLSKLDVLKTQKSKTIQTITKLLYAQDHISLLRSMYKLLPSCHNFEGIGILLYDYSSKRLYRVSNLERNQGPQSQYLSLNLGITGEIVNDHSIKIMDKTTMIRFYPEVDSIEGIKRMENLLYLPLFQDPPENTKLIGILQLANNLEGTVTKTDIELVKEMSAFYGLILLRTIERKNVINMMLKLKESSDVITSILVVFV